MYISLLYKGTGILVQEKSDLLMLSCVEMGYKKKKNMKKMRCQFMRYVLLQMFKKVTYLFYIEIVFLLRVLYVVLKRFIAFFKRKNNIQQLTYTCSCFSTITFFHFFYFPRSVQFVRF